jgi:hypothetical protein
MGDQAIAVLHASAWPTVEDTRVRRKGPAEVARELQVLAGELWGSAVGESLPNELLAIATELAGVGASIDAARVAELARLCAHCGHDRGDHLVDAPHACEHEFEGRDFNQFDCGCPGYLAPGEGYAPHDTERPPAPAFEEEPHIELAFPSALRGRP